MFIIFHFYFSLSPPVNIRHGAALDNFKPNYGKITDPKETSKKKYVNRQYL